MHQDFARQLQLAVDHPRCERVIVVTNGVVIPRGRESLRVWLEQLGPQFSLKLSINHYLLDHDPGLILLAQLLAELIAEPNELVINVRLRRGVANDDEAVLESVREAGLIDLSNVFYLQRYGRASGEEDWDEPFIVGENFTLANLPHR